jgi:hypothetical protein
MSNLEKTKIMYAQIGQGQLLEAFDSNYADSVIMEEPAGKREGKKACREYEVQFINSVEAFHNLEIKAISEDLEKSKVFIEVLMDITFKGENRVQMEKVAVQQWESVQIIQERFYYNAG